MKHLEYDVVIVGAGAGGLFAAYEFVKQDKGLKIALIEKGESLHNRRSSAYAIMNGVGGAGAFSDGKYNITTNFGGDIHEYIGKPLAMDLMEEVDKINLKHGGEGAKIYSTISSELKKEALKYDLHLLDAKVRHLGTDKNLIILDNMVKFIQDKVDLMTNTQVKDVDIICEHDYRVSAENKDKEEFSIHAKYIIIATGRSGSKWTKNICQKLEIDNQDNKVDIGIRFECPAEIWDSITQEVYESKIIYRSRNTGCECRTFCMNQRGEVVEENTNGLKTVNGHSYSDPKRHTDNTNFALLVTHRFTEPFKDSNAYGEMVATLTNMLAGGVMVQRFGDLLQNKRSNHHRINKSFTKPTLKKAEPGNLGLCMPKLTLDTIIEMIQQLDKLVPGTANFDNLLYGTEVKFYNSKVSLDQNFESKYKGLFFIGDCSGTTRSLSQASAEGIYVARFISGDEAQSDKMKP